MTTTTMATGDAIRRRQRRRRWRDDDDDNDDDPHRENFECDGATGNEVNVDWEFLFSDHLFRRSKYELNTIEDVSTNYSMQPQ